MPNPNSDPNGVIPELQDVDQLSQDEAAQIFEARIKVLERAGAGNHDQCYYVARNIWPQLFAKLEYDSIRRKMDAGLTRSQAKEAAANARRVEPET